MTGTDPMAAMWAALDTHGYTPKGELWKFTARCPAHEDRSPSLSVTEGVDRRTLVYCHAGCSVADVVAAIGLTMSDLFPVGHRKAAKQRVAVVAEQTPLAALVDALNTVGLTWSGVISSKCPYCDHPAAWWNVNQDRVEVDCPEECTRTEILDALEGRVAIAGGAS